MTTSRYALLKQLLWPLSSSPVLGVGPPADRRWWITTSALVFLPLAAIAHHSVFFYSECMLNPFAANDYTDLAVLKTWLLNDPSLPWAIGMAAAIYFAGNAYPEIKITTACFLVSFFLLTVWIWDIPFTDRIICTHANEGQMELLGFTVTSRHFYFLGLAAFMAFRVLIAQKRRSTT